MRQVGYLQGLYRDARSTEHRILLNLISIQNTLYVCLCYGKISMTKLGETKGRKEGQTHNIVQKVTDITAL